jgi:hypothetical protein
VHSVDLPLATLEPAGHEPDPAEKPTPKINAKTIAIALNHVRRVFESDVRSETSIDHTPSSDGHFVGVASGGLLWIGRRQRHRAGHGRLRLRRAPHIEPSPDRLAALRREAR